MKATTDCKLNIICTCRGRWQRPAQVAGSHRPQVTASHLYCTVTAAMCNKNTRTTFRYRRVASDVDSHGKPEAEFWAFVFAYDQNSFLPLHVNFYISKPHSMTAEVRLGSRSVSINTLIVHIGVIECNRRLDRQTRWMNAGSRRWIVTWPWLNCPQYTNNVKVWRWLKKSRNLRNNNL